MGAKRTDIVETLFGIREKASGIHHAARQEDPNNHSANEAINHGFALVTEERRSTGIYAYLDIGFNSLISNIKKYKNSIGLLDNSRMKAIPNGLLTRCASKPRSAYADWLSFPVVQPAKGHYRPLAADPAGDPDAG